MRYTHAEWSRLGRAVYTARLAKGLRDTQEWADAVGRSARTLLGLERGEPVGTGTVDAVAKALDWPPSLAYSFLNDPGFKLPSENVVSRVQGDPDSTETAGLIFRRPEGMSDDEWERRQSKMQGYWDALADDVARER